jgi:hypothetical protein
MLLTRFMACEERGRISQLIRLMHRRLHRVRGHVCSSARPVPAWPSAPQELGEGS